MTEDIEVRTLRLVDRFIDAIEAENANAAVSGAAATELLQRVLTSASELPDQRAETARIARAIGKDLLRFAKGLCQ